MPRANRTAPTEDSGLDAHDAAAKIGFRVLEMADLARSAKPTALGLEAKCEIGIDGHHFIVTVRRLATP